MGSFVKGRAVHVGSVDEVRESDFGRSGYLHYGLGNKHKNEELGLFVL